MRDATPLAGLGASGLVASVVVSVCGTPLGSARVSRLAGLVPAQVLRDHPMLLPRLTTAGAVVLLLCWLAAVRLAGEGRLGARGVWALAGLWGLPLLVGAPLLSADAYAYVADARLIQHGLDPYQVGPGALGHGALLDAVAARWRDAPAPYGPLGLGLLRLAGVAHGVAGPVLLLGLLAAGSVAVTGLAVSRLAGAGRRPVALATWLLAPVVLVHLVGGVHLDAAMLALAVLALLLAHRGHPLAAAALAGLATAVKVPAVLVVAAVCVSALPVGRWPAARALAARAAAALAAYLLTTPLAPDPLGLRHGLRVPGRSETLSAPVSLLARTLGGLWADPLPAVRAAGLALAALVALGLLVTAGRRPVAATAGWSLLALVLLGPVLYPWYAAWPLACLAPVVAGRQRRVLLAVVAVMSFAALPGLDRLSAYGVGIVLVLVTVLAAAVWWLTRPAAAVVAVPAQAALRPAR